MSDRPAIVPRDIWRTWCDPEIGPVDPSPPSGIDASGARGLGPDLSGSVRRIQVDPPNSVGPGEPCLVSRRCAECFLEYMVIPVVGPLAW